MPLLDETCTSTTVPLARARGLQGLVGRPFEDPRRIVLRTSDRAMQGLFECIAHSAAVVGLNTSAELEAAIVGKPVYTVLAGAATPTGRHTTLHFHYLLEASGGFVRIAHGLDEHVAQLDRELTSPSTADGIRRFVGEFLRPHGVEHPVSPLLAEALERTFAGWLCRGRHAGRPGAVGAGWSPGWRTPLARKGRTRQTTWTLRWTVVRRMTQHGHRRRSAIRRP